MNTMTDGIANHPARINSITAAPLPQVNEFRDLARVAREAARLKPPLYLRSIFGDPTDWLPPHDGFSEYNIIDPWRPLTTARFLTDVTVPAFTSTSPDWARMLFPPAINRLFWRPTSFFCQPNQYGSVSTFPREHWMFINGVATNRDVARLNAAYLAHLFHRPVSVIQNSTDSLLVDLFECAIGKGLNDNPSGVNPAIMTEPAWRATAAVLEALNAQDTQRVVVIAHSQGTIILANVLRAISEALQSDEAKLEKPRWHAFTNGLMGRIVTKTQKILRDNLAHALFEFTKGEPGETFDRLAKLEIYTFANCADKMLYVYPNQQVPYMEHYANERDLVARLGVLSPLRSDPARFIEIDGPVFEQKGKWGHLLNVLYLAAIDEYLYPGPRNHGRTGNPFPAAEKGASQPRLYQYFHDKQPQHGP